MEPERPDHYTLGDTIMADSPLFRPASNSVAIPETVRGGRPKQDNPTLPLIAELVAEGVPSTKARVLRVPDSANAPKVGRLLQAAGRESGVTIRISVEDDKKTGASTIAYWATPRVVRNAPVEETAA